MSKRTDSKTEHAGWEPLMLAMGFIYIVHALICGLDYYFPQLSIASGTSAAAEILDYPYVNIITKGALILTAGVVVFIAMYGLVYRRTWFYWVQSIVNIPAAFIFVITIGYMLVPTWVSTYLTFISSYAPSISFAFVYLLAEVIFVLAGVSNIGFYFLDKNMYKKLAQRVDNFAVTSQGL